MTLNQDLVEILRCPDSHHARLEYDDVNQTLTCGDCRKVFPVRDDVPILLLDEAFVEENDQVLDISPEITDVSCGEGHNAEASEAADGAK